MTHIVWTLAVFIFAGWVGYMGGCEDTQKEFQDTCINTGLYQTKEVNITCDVTSHTISGKTFFIIKEQ